MTGFDRDSNGMARLGGTPLGELLAEAGVETPTYLYDLDAIALEVQEVKAAFGSAPHRVAYALKANSAGSVVRCIAGAGGGADVVSGGELQVALGCGVSPRSIVMSGVAKSDDELDRAIGAGILAIQLESLEELPRVAARARALGRVARVSFRLNPNVTIDSHAHVATGHDAAKFGILPASLGAAWARADADPAIAAVGVSTHVGSMLSSVEPYLASARVVCDAAKARLASGKPVEFVDFGGGFGVDYGSGPTARPAEFVRAALSLLDERGLGQVILVVEPGRSMVGPHGVLVASLVQIKVAGARRWAFIDAAMNDLLRPALYGSPHRIEPLDRHPGEPLWRVAGPVCESADDFGEHPLGASPSSRFVIRDVGAYGYTMASEYNGRPLAPEVFVSAGRVQSVSRPRDRGAWVRERLEA